MMKIQRSEGAVAEMLAEMPLIFWDFDGVIKESVQVKTAAYCALFSKFGASVESQVRAHHLENGGMSRFDKIPLYLQLAKQQVTAESIDQYCAEFARIVEDSVVGAAWVPGVESLLREQRGERIFVLVTATPQAEIETILHRINLSSCFTKVYGAPIRKAEAISTTLKELDMPASAALMIGDSREDLSAAQASGVNFLLRRTPENSSTMPDYQGIFCEGFE